MYLSNRVRTRDRLLEYDRAIVPPRPRQAGLGIVYPWESPYLTSISNEIYILAANSGFDGTYEDFLRNFGSYLQSNYQDIIYADYDNFPPIGSSTKLYFDLVEKILYYWTGSDYMPVNAMLIAHTILEGGEA